MRTTVIWSFLSLMALATGGLVAGCDSDAKIAKSAAGESCDKTSDCNEGLKCFDGTCYKSASTSTGGSANNEGGEANSTAGTTFVPAKPPVLGGEGESCTRRADCEDGLACLSQRCQKDAAMGMGGEGSVGPVLGGPGETCGLTSDCGPGMACLPNGVVAPVDTLAIGSNSVGVCTLLDSGLTPTGKTCGHECIEASDCCELPLAQQTATGASSCSDLADLAAAVPSCATAVGVNGIICLAYSAYCDDQCGKNTWACEAGACYYTAKCTKATEVVGGCPKYTRAGSAVPACDTKTSKCAAPAPEVVGCTTDAKCLNAAVADHPTDTCTADECVCDKPTGGCYRKCSENTDCENGYNCDADTSLCVPIGACATDLQCIQQSRDIRAKCTDGTCHVPCDHDIDCNPGGLINGAFNAVCGPDKTCQPLGCTTDDECFNQPIGTLHSFCDTPAAGATTTAPRSAITD